MRNRVGMLKLIGWGDQVRWKRRTVTCFLHDSRLFRWALVKWSQAFWWLAAWKSRSISPTAEVCSGNQSRIWQPKRRRRKKGDAEKKTIKKKENETQPTITGHQKTVRTCLICVWVCFCLVLPFPESFFRACLADLTLITNKYLKLQCQLILHSVAMLDISRNF